MTDRDKLNLTAVQLYVLEALYRLFPDRNIYERARQEKIEMFDKVLGSPEIRKALFDHTSVEDVLRKIDQQRSLFMIKREKYLLYE